MEQRVLSRLGKYFQVGSEVWNSVGFTRKRIRWPEDSPNRLYIEVSQEKAIDELEKIPVERNTKEDLHSTPSMHTMYRRQLGQINWLQSRTQFQCCYKFSRCASMAASPIVGDVKSRNKLARQIKSQPVKLQYWPLTGPLRTLGFPDASYRNNDDGSSQRGMTVFLVESRKRSSRDGMAYGSLIDDQSQKIKKTVLSTTVAELYSFMKCFGSCQFLRADCGWTYLVKLQTFSRGVMRRTLSLQQERIICLTNRISMLRREACAGSIHDLAHMPTQNCLADCLTKTSATADNLITAVKTGKLLHVEIHPDVRTLMEHKAFLSTWCRTILHTREKEVFLPEHSQDLTCTNSSRKTISRDVCGYSADNGAKGIEYTWGSRPRCYENNICLRRLMHPISLVSGADSDDNTDMDGVKKSHRITIEVFTEEIEEARFVRQYNFFFLPIRIFCLRLALMTFCFVLRSLLLALWPWRYQCHIVSWSLTDYDCTMTVPVKTIIMKPLHYLDTASTWSLMKRPWRQRKLLRRQENSGIDPTTMKMRQWYQRHDRVSEKNAPTGTDRASDQAQRLAMRQGDMPPKVPERVANREFEKTEQCGNSNITRKRCTVPPAKTPTQEHGLKIVEASFKSVRKAGPDVDLYNVSTYKCSILFNNMGSMKSSTLPTSSQLTKRRKGVAWCLWLCGMSFEHKQWPVSTRKNWFFGIYSPFMGIRWWQKSVDMRQKEQPQNCVSDRLSSSLTI